MKDVGLKNLGYHGSEFTWFNGREGGAEVWKILDRILSRDT